jgi:nucleoside-diphosphate-sugar epimerase
MSDARSVLITGAAGFVARGVARALADAGLRVTGLDRVVPPAATDRGAPFAEFWQCDLLDEGALAALSTRGAFTAVVHLAGVLPGQVTRKELFAINVGGTSALLEHLARPASHVVFVSTGLVYGKQPGPFREDMECSPVDAYAQSKLAAEALVRSWGRAAEAPVTVLRPSVIYGRDAPPAMLLVSLLAALRGEEPFRMTAGEQLRDFLHVDDAASAVATVLARHAAGTFNLASGESHSVRAAVELGASIANRPELLRIGALPYRANEIFDYRLDNGSLRALGWQPRVSLAAGLQRLWEETR